MVEYGPTINTATREQLVTAVMGLITAPGAHYATTGWKDGLFEEAVDLVLKKLQVGVIPGDVVVGSRQWR